MFEISRYRREFNEIGCIGKGGYGKVYHVKHKLDGADYAIKKITLSSARVRRIEERGQDELDRLLMEVRTLARFDHPNIVRYYGGWLEYTMPAASGPAASSDEPQLTLHIQMSLHPLSLADFLSPQSESLSNQGFEFRHCFHPQISMRILLAILDGVQYLHSTRLIHRDLKPSNIFLSFHSSPSLSCIDLSSCQTCTHPRTPTPYLTIRIGDFGLVTEIAQPDGGASSVLASKAVGTELYRPHDSSGKLDESLDVYALGIIAVELLQRFETKMERLGRLGDARSGKFDGVVAERTVEGGDELLECIRRMICEEKERFSCREVRERIEKFLSP
ncbi:kinase-like protein [Tothia fuscella]|uniref:Kinase-like protein n=1 Tax=Tothia fuscella TaxID=1048955 RepID=A0A9P4NSA7_9PEZI|nr:kinase-like protein [Tothia fuscella]